MLDRVLKQAMAVLVIALVAIIYRFIRNKTRVKLKNEDTKVKYLEHLFESLVTKEIDVKKSIDKEVKEVLQKYSNFDVSKIRIEKPYSKKSTWRVYAFVGNEKIGIYSVLDDELDNLLKKL